LKRLAQPLKKSGYGNYLLRLLSDGMDSVLTTAAIKGAA